MDVRSSIRWLVVVCVLGVIAGSASAAVSGSNAETAKALRDRAVALAERGEVGEALDVAHRAASLAPRDAESRKLVASLEAQASGDPRHP